MQVKIRVLRAVSLNKCIYLGDCFMSDSTVETAFTLQYGTMIQSLSQQVKPRFVPRVRPETIVGAKAKAFERLGEAESQDSTVRHGDTPLNEIEHTRRWVTMTDTDTGALLDKQDSWKMLIDPKNKYTQHQAMELGRKQDDKIIAAALGTATAGEERATSVLFKDDSISINGDGTATALGTLATPQTEVDITLAKMLLMMQIFNQEDVDPSIRKFWGVNPKAIADLLALTQVGSADFATVKNLQNGSVEFYAGFHLFWSNRITKDTTDQTCYRSIAWAEDGIIFGQAQAIQADIDKRPDKKNAWQVYSVISCGAVRFEGEKVHECLNKVA
jgi:hypothetical protein